MTPTKVYEINVSPVTILPLLTMLRPQCCLSLFESSSVQINTQNVLKKKTKYFGTSAVILASANRKPIAMKETQKNSGGFLELFTT